MQLSFVRVCCVLIISLFSFAIFGQSKNQQLFEKAFQDQNPAGKTIQSAMTDYKIPGLSIAILQGDTIDTFVYGVTESDSASVILPNTLFQAASVSKVLTALGVLRLVTENKVDLDQDINAYLKSWKLPTNKYNQENPVTVRHLLTHTGGISVSGFKGYLKQNDIPSLLQVLKGESPTNSPPITNVLEPGKQWAYSGGGTTILQLLIEEVTGEKFDEWMGKNILQAIGLDISTFKTPNSIRYSIAKAHDEQGQVIPGGWHYYPELAAAGLWSTPYELLKVIQFIQELPAAQDQNLFSQELIKELFSPHIFVSTFKVNQGLGVFLVKEQDYTAFFHPGTNEGFISFWMGYTPMKQGVVIMINSSSQSAAKFMLELYDTLLSTFKFEENNSRVWLKKNTIPEKS